MLLSRLPFIISLLLVVAFGGIIYLQVNEILIPEKANASTINTTEAKSIIPNQKQKSFNIASFKLFGSVQKQAPKVEEIPDKLPKTKLRLTLTGVQAGEIESESGALIEGPDRDTSYYKVGDELPGNATLKRVFADRVVIQRSGKLENLYFPESFSSGKGLLASNNTSPDLVKTPSKPLPSATPKANNISDVRKQNIKDRLSKLRQRINNGQ